MRKLLWTKALVLLLAFVFITSGCKQQKADEEDTAMRIKDREAIEETVHRANLGFEQSDADLFAGAFAEDAVFELDAKAPVFGFDKMSYQGRDDIRRIITDQREKFRKTDPKTLSFDPATLKMYIRNSDERIKFLDSKTAQYTSTWMAVIKTNVDIHISAIGRYTNTMGKRDGKWFIVKCVRSE